MSDPPKQFYWDSCVFLSLVEGHADRTADIQALLTDAQGGKVEILTATVSIVEVAFAKQEKDRKVLDPEAEKRIDRLWAPPSPVKLVEFHSAIAKTAKDLMRDAMVRGWSLRGMDAIHLATAQLLAVKKMHTYDDSLQKFGQLIGITIEEPSTTQVNLDLRS